MLSGPKISVGDKQVKGLLQDLNHLKTHPEMKLPKKNHLGGLLTRTTIRLLKDNMSDHLLITTLLWILVSLLRIDSCFHSILLDAGAPGALVEILQDPTVTDVAKEYASELTSALM